MQEGLSPLCGEFTNAAPLLDLLTDVAQQLQIFVIVFAVTIARPLWLEECVTSLPHAQ
jgi:hypothetical protein